MNECFTEVSPDTISRLLNAWEVPPYVESVDFGYATFSDFVTRLNEQIMLTPILRVSSMSDGED